MKCTASPEKLHDYVDGTLGPEQARALEHHIATCSPCREQLASLRSLLKRAATLDTPLATPGRDLWPAIAERLASSPPLPRLAIETSRGARLREWLPPLAAAASLVFVIAVLAWKALAPRPSEAWTVASLAGAPRAGAHPVQGEAQLHVGDWLETDNAARARLDIGRIGEVSIEPNSRVRLVAATDADHRLELSRGTLHALIWAPPRLFFVETPSATAIDLGCAYTLTVDDAGNGLLHVTAGYVAMAHEGRESIVPAGALCHTRPGATPGTPFAADASPEFRAALARFDFEPPSHASLHEILSHARETDAITLWHLLSRAHAEERIHVFDALARLQPPPAGVTRAGIFSGDQPMLAAWAAALGLPGEVLRAE
jgi:hypothetical protein